MRHPQEPQDVGVQPRAFLDVSLATLDFDAASGNIWDEDICSDGSSQSHLFLGGEVSCREGNPYDGLSQSLVLG